MTHNTDRIITLNLGMGRDSVTMLCLLKEGALRTRLDGPGSPMVTLSPADIDAVVFSDTGAEWDHTYAAIVEVRELVESMGLGMVVLEKPSDSDFAQWVAAKASDSKAKQHWVEELSCDGYGRDCIARKAEQGGYHLRGKLMDDYMRIGTIASRGGACTCNHKLNCIRRFIADLSAHRFGLTWKNPNAQWGEMVRRGERKKHVSLVGFAADEKNRQEGHDEPDYHGSAFPLVDMGLTKADEAPILERHGLNHIRKSGCVCCPMQPSSWYWALSMTRPDLWEQVKAYEAKALANNPKMFVKGSRTIGEEMAGWRRNNPDATVDACLDKSYGSGPQGASRCSVRSVLMELLATGTTRQELVAAAELAGSTNPKGTVSGLLSALRRGKLKGWTLATTDTDNIITVTPTTEA